MVAFSKMHGNGNDFVVIDGRASPVALTSGQIAAIGDRHRGVGFDQLILIEGAAVGSADLAMRFYNADGSLSGACGNGTRCAAAQVMQAEGRDTLAIETAAGLLRARKAEGGLYTVDMGPAHTGWREIPLAEDTDTLHLGIACGPLSDPAAVGMGNPHCVFFVENAEAVDLPVLGPQIEYHPLFPERTNVELATIMPNARIRVRVWERGAGITQACGSGACAVLVAASRRGLVGRAAYLLMDGGNLHAEWREEDGHVLLTGPVAHVFQGEIDLEAIADSLDGAA